MTPASDEFCRAIELMGFAAMYRKAAEQGGDVSGALARLAGDRSKQADELMRSVIAVTPAQPW